MGGNGPATGILWCQPKKDADICSIIIYFPFLHDFQLHIIRVTTTLTDLSRSVLSSVQCLKLVRISTPSIDLNNPKNASRECTYLHKHAVPQGDINGPNEIRMHEVHKASLMDPMR